MSDWGRGSAPVRRGGSRLPVFLIGLILGIALPVALFIFGPRYGLPVENIVSSTVSNENAQLKARIEGLERQVALAEDALESSQNRQQSESPPTAVTDKTEVDNLRAQLKLAEDVTTELQSQLEKAFNEDIPTLKKDIEARDAALKQFDDEITRLTAVERDYESLKTERSKSGVADETKLRTLQTELKKRDAAIAQLDDEIARLSSVERELKALRAEKPESEINPLQAELDKAREEVATLKKELASRDEMLGKLDAEFSRLSPLEGEVDDLRARLAIADKTTEDTRARLQDRLDEAERTLETTRKSLAESESELDRLRDENARLAKAEQPAAKPEPAPDKDNTPRELSPRDPFRVAEAMRDARGLDNLGDVERDRIANGLIEGQCVSKVLSDAFGKPPALAVRDLISALESNC